jgi:hypothetical protein
MKRIAPRISMILIAAIVAMLTACSSGPVRTETRADDLNRYRNAYIADVVVRSTENSANAQEENRKVEEFARAELQRIIEASRYRYLPARPASTAAAEAGEQSGAHNDNGGSVTDELARTLAVSLSMDITWGNRALRYLVGFGAGQGRISSALTVKDAATGAVKYRSSKDSMLAMGLFGGSMEPIVRENIAGLLAEYPGQP